VSRANHTTDQAKLPLIVRVGLCGHRRLRRHGATQAATAPRRATRKAERRTARRSGLWPALWHNLWSKRGKVVRTASRMCRLMKFHLIESHA